MTHLCPFPAVSALLLPQRCAVFVSTQTGTRHRVAQLIRGVAHSTVHGKAGQRAECGMRPTVQEQRAFAGSDMVSTEENAKLLQPFQYISDVPGKLVRTKLAHAFNYWLKIPSDKLNAVGEIVQMLHNASLLIDDIQDNSILRRGVPVAHSIYGIASTINAANYVMFIALEKVLNLNHPEATRVYTEQLLELHRGQGLEIYWRDNFCCPTEEDYKAMTVRKTGGLFMLAIRLMQLFSNNKEDFTKLTGILGLYFQIRDDYNNLCSQEYVENKSFCEDLTEGKFSFPIIHAIRSRPDDTKIMHILRQRTRDVEVKKYCVRLLELYGSFTYTRDLLSQLDADARAEVARLGGNPLMDSLLDELLAWKKMTSPDSPISKTWQKAAVSKTTA